MNIDDLRAMRMHSRPSPKQMDFARRIADYRAAVRTVDAEVEEMLRDIDRLARATLAKALPGEFATGAPAVTRTHPTPPVARTSEGLAQ